MADALERLTNLLALLIETREPQTLEQIADALHPQYPTNETARRGAFERDKAMLRSEGVPIEQVVLSGDRAGATGYWIDRRRYELDLGLTAEETRALQLAVAAVHLGVEWAEDALLKLGGDDAPSDTPLAVLPSLPMLPVLLEANATRATVRFRYRGEDRRLDPYGLLARDGFWYVVGRDHRSGERRTFRVDRVEGDVRLGPAGAFEVPAGFDPSEALPDDPKTIGVGEPSEALVLVDAVRAGKVVRETGEGAVVERHDDGGVVVRVPCTNLPAFASWVLGLLDHAVVLGPPHAVAAVVDHLAAIAGP